MLKKIIFPVFIVLSFTITVLSQNTVYDYFQGWDKNTARAGREHITDKRTFASLTVIMSDESSLYIDSDWYGKGTQYDIVLPSGTYPIKITGTVEAAGTVTLVKGQYLVNTLTPGEKISAVHTGSEKLYASVRVICNTKAQVYKRVFRAMVPVGTTAHSENLPAQVVCYKLAAGKLASRETCTKVHPGEETVFEFTSSRSSINLTRISRSSIAGNKIIPITAPAEKRNYTVFSVRTPEPARVYLDAAHFADAPFFGRYVNPGRYTVRIVSMDKKREHVNQYVFSGGNTLSLDTALIEPGMGALTIDSYPSGKIFIGTRCLGYGPRRHVQMPRGRYTYRIEYKTKGIQSTGTIDASVGVHREMTDFLRDKIE